MVCLSIYLHLKITKYFGTFFFCAVVAANDHNLKCAWKHSFVYVTSSLQLVVQLEKKVISSALISH